MPTAVADHPVEYHIGEVGIELVGYHLGVGAGHGDLAVLGGVLVGADHAHPGGGPVDGSLEAVGQGDAASVAAFSRP